MVGCAEFEVRFKNPVKKFTQLYVIIIKVCLLRFKGKGGRMDTEGTTKKTFIEKLKNVLTNSAFWMH